MKKEINKVILCIGTSKCVGDSLGPIVGENLYKKINKSNIYIFGNLKNNITYQNVDIVLNRINKIIKNPYLIVVDSALASKEYLGQIIISKNRMIIGSALDKASYNIGNLNIKGVVGENKNSCIKNYKELNSVSINLIKRLSFNISNKILDFLNV